MNLFNDISRFFSNLPDISSVKAWYDGTITYKTGEFLGDLVLDVICSEIRLSLCINEDSFKDRFINVTPEGMICLANELNSNIDTISFSALADNDSPCLLLHKSFYYTTRDEAIRYLNQSITNLKRIAETTLSVAGLLFDNKDITNFYDIINGEIDNSMSNLTAQDIPPLNILIVDDLFSKNLTSVKSQLMKLLPKCRIYEAENEPDPSYMLRSLEYMIIDHNNKIDIIIAYGSGCFFAHQLSGYIPRILINPNFYIADELKHAAEAHPCSYALSYDIDVTIEKMEIRQFTNISRDGIDNTVGYFDMDMSSDQNVETYNLLYGPIYRLCENWFAGDEFTRFKLIPTIERLYYKSNGQPFKANITRIEFAERLRAVVADHIAHPRPRVYNGSAYIKVSRFTNDIYLDSGYRVAKLIKITKDGDDIEPDEDVINYLVLMRFPDQRVKEFIKKILSVIEPYSWDDHKLKDILLVINKSGLMDVRYKDKPLSKYKNKTEDIYPLSRFVSRDARHKFSDVSMVALTAIALKYIPVEGLTNPQ